MVAQLFLLALGMAACALLTFAVAMVHRHPSLGFVAFGGVILTLWEFPAQGALASLGGFSVYPNDIIALVLFSAGLLRWSSLRSKLGDAWFIAWLFFGVLITASTVLGVLSFGPGPAIVDARSFFYIFAAMTWGFAVPLDSAGLRRLSLWIGWGLTAMCLLHGLQHGFGGADQMIDIDGTQRTARPLVAGQAMVLALCAGTLILGSSKPRQQLALWSGVAFLVVVMIAQHRSVWASCLVAFAVVLLIGRSGKIKARLVGITVVSVWAGAIVALIGLQGALGSLGEQLLYAFESRGTLEARQSSWPQLIARSIDEGLPAVIFGQPFGAGYLRLEGGSRAVGYSPHNWYVHLFLRVGLVGLAIWIALVLRGLTRTRKTGREAGLFILTSLAVFGWAYSVAWFMAVWLCWALVHTAEGRPSSSGKEFDGRRAVQARG